MLAVYQDSELQAWQKKGNFSEWKPFVMNAFDEKLLGFSSENIPCAPNLVSKTFTLRKLQIINGFKLTVADYTINSVELKQKIGLTGDFYYFLADKAIYDIIAAWSSDDLVSAIYEFHFAITVKGINGTFRTSYYTDLFCYGFGTDAIATKSTVSGGGTFKKDTFGDAFNKF